jgi:DNA polymerase III delta prime subunit
MDNNKDSTTTTDSKDNHSLNYNSLIKAITDNGDLLILGSKGTTKTTLLMHLARELRKDSKNHIIIFETFPKWIKEFDNCPYITIADSDIQPKQNLPHLQEDKTYIQWSKDFAILNADYVTKFLKENKDGIHLILSDDMEKISAYMTFVLYSIYRKQYQRAYYGRLESVNENFWFLVEESHNLLDSSTVQKKTFQKLRKIHNEFRNLKMVCVALRLQDLNPKIRSKMSILLSRISLDDYQLKVRALLRNSQYKDVITELPKGTFVYPELDFELKTEPFKQEGAPYQWKPKPTEQPIPEPEKPTAKKGFWSKLFNHDLPDIKGSHEYEAWKDRQLRKRRLGIEDSTVSKLEYENEYEKDDILLLE